MTSGSYQKVNLQDQDDAVPHSYQQTPSSSSKKSSKYHSLKEEYEEEIAQGVPCNIYHKKNVAIVLAYFSIGVVQSFPSTPLNIYLVETLNAEPQLQNTIGILQTLPWSMKLAFGFLSDAVPIFGMHRKPYLCLGSLLFSLSFIVYYINGQNNLMLLAVCIFVGTLGLIQMDVMVDTMCVQRSKFEAEESKGQMQASCYSIRFAGNLVGAIMGATLCNKKSWGWGLDYFEVSVLTGLIPFILVTPFLFR
jgi:MFS family permease